MHPDASGFLKVKPGQEEIRADTTSDLLLQQALTRRALGFELANLASYESAQALTAKLMKEYMRTPLDGYHRVSIQQLERADRAAFIKIAEITSGGVQRGADGLLPCDNAFLMAVADMDVTYLLMQLPKTKSSSSSSGAKRNRSRSHSASRQERNKGAKGRGSKGAKARGKGSSSQPRTKTVAKTSAGDPICFSFNKAQGCSNAVTNNRCSRGIHVCWFAGCQQQHSGAAHPWQ
jgi:hypothetical protein